MPFRIVHGDITRMRADAIVNAANSRLAMGGGVCGAIFRAAGPPLLQEECRRIGECPVGEAVITGAGHLPARHIIHTVGPVWQGGRSGEEDLLRGCYGNSLRLALEHGCGSIAFPLISAGIFGYPKSQAMQVAASAIADFLAEHDMQVDLVIYDTGSFYPHKETLAHVQEFINAHIEFPPDPSESPFACDSVGLTEEVDTAEGVMGRIPFFAMVGESIADEPERFAQLAVAREESFSRKLLRLIDEKGLRDADAYKRANVDRRLFSKIRSNEDYHPSRNTAIAFAIALELDWDETNEFLASAGYTLSRSRPFDLIIEYFIREQNYNIHEINVALFACDQALLGA